MPLLPFSLPLPRFMDHPSPAPWPLPFWIAHRGAGRQAPENTLAAFRLGAAHGYTAFECDVKRSADGELFLLHDDTLARTTDGGDRVAGSLDWAELSRLDAGSWHTPGYAGEPLPRLDAIARACRANGWALNIEIKPTPGDEGETGAAVGRAVQRLWAGAARWPLLSSFRPEALAAAQAVAPELPRGLLLDTLWEGWPDIADRLAVQAVVTNHRVMDAPLAERLHAGGRRALCYTVNEPADAHRLIDLGIDGLITDAVQRFAPNRTDPRTPG